VTHALFISDLHLHATRPLTTAAFFRFLAEDAPAAAQLFILGDLFEFWVGDDQLEHDPLAADVAKRLAALAESGTKISLMHGNRDFLIGERFAAAAHVTLLPDPTTVNLGGKPLLLMHGDTLCTDDVAYQQFRKQARDPAWQVSILNKPYAERVALAQAIRERSTTEKATKAEDIMDVTPATVAATFRAHGYIDMIHGHTHRPAKHQHEVDGRICNRTVLADWHDEAQYQRVGQLRST
jgi:UDP-2,3-diacylglucosamine hydrolase